MSDPSHYQLKVSGGPGYKDQSEIKVNTAESLTFSSKHLDARVHVRVKDFRGLPEGSPSDCSYFQHPKHTWDRYSISFSFVPKTGDINGNDLVFGNDFDHPIRDRLPPLFDKALNIVKGWIDPGLYGDPYADEPYLYGPLLSSVNILRIGEKGKNEGEAPKVEATDDLQDSGPVIEEGADSEEAEAIRKEGGLPATNTGRQKHFLSEDRRKAFTFEQGRTYACDFSNAYLDFNEFALRLPMGLRLNILGHWDGQPLREHHLRYVLKNRATDEVLFVVNFALLPITDEAKAARAKLEEETGSKKQVDEVAEKKKEPETENDDLD